MMEMAQASSRYWREALAAGGFTGIPRWVLDPVNGVALHDLTIGEGLTRKLRELADELDVPVRSILLAAHARVLAALSGERDVTTGYVATEGGRPLPCRLATWPDSWRTLVLGVHRVESDVIRYRDFPVDDLRREMGHTEPAFETVFDPAGSRDDLAPDVVLRLNVVERNDRIGLRLHYRTDRMDAECAARIAGYHRTALELFVADPEAEHRRQSLLSAEEMDLQLEGLAGPRRQLPECRAHELFEQRVLAHPDRIAAEFGNRQWSYRELNERANRLGRTLLDRGLEREQPVAVVTERNLNWMTAVLAVLKAGGVYLPVEPHFPPDRITNMLSRARCRLLLTEEGSTTTLDGALDSLPEVQKILIDAACEESSDGSNLGVPVAPHQAAYIYFTSGSTGEPKGAMCEHAGMLNHLFAKIDDFQIEAGDVVSQTAPQCFDISLWQLVSALLVGGRTLIIEQSTILDVERFVDRVVEGRVAVMQLVPSYLEVVLTYLEQNRRPLPDLRLVSVTGEAVTVELVRRWFAAKPAIRLANAYGLTETSDDTNHEVMQQTPDGERVPLGRAVNNVHVYVVDQNLSPVPLGAPGEIVFSGICVGRGYVNDPERTKLAFMDDPLREGQRLYRSGDYGFWRPDGKLEFLGRRDAQVKIRGFRIEIGEIENRLSRVPGVRQAAVVIADGDGRSKQLVAFYSGERLDARDLEDRLGGSLPAYMVPSAFHWRDDLPLTANGKVNKKTLTALAVELGGDRKVFSAPATASERRVAEAWAKVLGVTSDQISRQDHFFDRGGTSLTAVKLVIALNRAVSLADVTRHPVLADLARLVDGESGIFEPAEGGDRDVTDATA